MPISSSTAAGSGWTQQAYLKASNPQMSAGFGHHVALSADGATLAVSAFWESSNATGINGNQRDESIPQAGAAYVFTRRGSAWWQQAYIKASNTGEAGTADSFGEGDQFGFSLALSADGATLAVGALTEDSAAAGINGNQADNSAASAGAVYVFSRAGGSWSQQAYIKPSNGESQDSFGVDVALSDDGGTLLVGSLDEDCTAPGVNAAGCDNDWRDDLSMGAAYVFVRSGTNWSQQAFLKASNTGTNDWFGSRLALSGDGSIAAIGASLEDGAAKGVNGRQDNDTASEAGAVYLFTRTGSAWRQQANIKGVNTEAFDEFGGSVVLDRSGSLLVVAAPGEDSGTVPANPADNSAEAAGAVYVFALTR